MLPTFAAETSAFEFTQDLHLVYRETPRTPPAATKRPQQGLFLVQSRLAPPRVVRRIEQCLLSEETMARLRKVEQAPRMDIAEEHLDHYFDQPQRRFGLEVPVELETDARGGGAALSGEPPPGQPRLALPYDALHFPLVTPALPAEDPAVGKSWKAVISVRCGFGTFALPYSAVWIALATGRATAQMTFDPPTGQEKPQVLNGIHLQYRPAGTWTVAFSLLDGSPVMGKGSLQYVVTATEPPEPEVTEILNVKLEFKWRKVPIGFTNKALMTASWGLMPPEPGF